MPNTWQFRGPGGIGWGRTAASGAPPIQTITPPPLWDHPAPPQINNQPPPPEPDHIVMPSPHPGGAQAGLYLQFPQRPPLGTMPQILPNDRHPVTGAPIFNPALPPDNPLPPGQQSIAPGGQHPITGAPTFRPVPTAAQAFAGPGGVASYPWRHHEREETAPLPPFGAVPTVQGEIAQPEQPSQQPALPAAAPSETVRAPRRPRG